MIKKEVAETKKLGIGVTLENRNSTTLRMA